MSEVRLRAYRPKVGLERRARMVLRRFGLDARRWREFAGLDLEPFYGRAAVLRSLDVPTILDIGANQGQYAGALRAAGWNGRIWSFEPLSEPYAVLTSRAALDPMWACQQLALAAEGGERSIYVSDNSAGSSFLSVTSHMVEAIPEMAVVATEKAVCERLDQVQLPGGPYFVKIDVQGFERQVLEGATGILRDVAGLELELSFDLLYEGGTKFGSMLQYVAKLGYELKAVIPGVPNVATGLALQVDGIFAKTLS